MSRLEKSFSQKRGNNKSEKFPRFELSKGKKSQTNHPLMSSQSIRDSNDNTFRHIYCHIYEAERENFSALPRKEHKHRFCPHMTQM